MTDSPRHPDHSDIISDQLALSAVRNITKGMTVGLGTGRAAARGIRALAAINAAMPLDLVCVATSVASEQLASSLGLTTRPPGEVSTLDYLFDGADEVDGRMCMLKGAGGAMTRERIVASMVRPEGSDLARRIYMIDASKRVASLGSRMPLPIEVLQSALAGVQAGLMEIGMQSSVRTKDGKAVITDNGHLILDARLDVAALQRDAGLSLSALASELDSTPGVVDHGLFLIEADMIIVEPPPGSPDMNELVFLRRSLLTPEA